MFRTFRWLVLAFGILLAPLGCKPPKPNLKKSPEMIVVQSPIVESVTDYEDFTGHTEAFAKVEIRAQVTGYLKVIHFRDGDDVHAGDPLFEIDPDLFQAEFERATAMLDQSQQTLAKARDTFDRNEKSERAVSEADRVGSRVDLKLNEAVVAGAKAMLKTAKKNLEFTKIVAPISGRLSRRQIDPGNLVRANDTLLTTIVAQDPIYASFDVDERTLLKLRRLIASGSMPSARETKKVSVKIGTSDEEGYSLSGLIEFSENQADPNTGTLRVRAILSNRSVLWMPSLTVGGSMLAQAPVFAGKHQLLTPGLFVRFRLPVSRPLEKKLVLEDAIGSDQGNKFIYVFKPNGKTENVEQADKKVEMVEVGTAERRDVTLGALVEKERYTPAGVAVPLKYRVIERGVEPNELVVVEGMQRVRDPKTPMHARKKP